MYYCHFYSGILLEKILPEWFSSVFMSGEELRVDLVFVWTGTPMFLDLSIPKNMEVY